MATGVTTDMELDWDVLQSVGPALASHAGCLLGNSFYIHGGITKYGSTSPSDKLHRMDLSSNSWQEVRQPGSPALSHHCCVALKNRYMILVGGWNGRQRSSKVYAFDSMEQKWLFPTDAGFPDGAGLSSHTATGLRGGDILVIGREGSLRMQRKHGSVFLLQGDVEKGSFTYTPYTTGTASRSGHTATIVGNTLYIVGGRDDRFVEMRSGFHSDSPPGTLTSKFSEVAGRLKPVAKQPAARKNHVAIGGQGALLLHGGETFDGRTREPVGEIYLMTKSPPTFYKVGNSSVARAFHVCCSDGNRVLMHGGIAGRGVILGDSYQLKIKPEGKQMTSKQKILAS